MFFSASELENQRTVLTFSTTDNAIFFDVSNAMFSHIVYKSVSRKQLNIVDTPCKQMFRVSRSQDLQHTHFNGLQSYLL